MNTTPKDHSPIEIMNDLDRLVSAMQADVTDRVLGPVVEHDYYVHQDTIHFGLLFKEGLHRIVSDADGYAIAYSGPGEEG